jgi:hypothetical protein
MLDLWVRAEISVPGNVLAQFVDAASLPALLDTIFGPLKREHSASDNSTQAGNLTTPLLGNATLPAKSERNGSLLEALHLQGAGPYDIYGGQRLYALAMLSNFTMDQPGSEPSEALAADIRALLDQGIAAAQLHGARTAFSVGFGRMPQCSVAREFPSRTGVCTDVLALIAQETPTVTARAKVRYRLGEDGSVGEGSVTGAGFLIPSVVERNPADKHKQAVELTVDIQFTAAVEAITPLDADGFGLFVVAADGEWVHVLEAIPDASMAVLQGPGVAAPSTFVSIQVLIPSSFEGSPSFIIALKPLDGFLFEPAVFSTALAEFSLVRRGCNLVGATNYNPKATASAGNCDFPPVPIGANGNAAVRLVSNAGKDAMKFDLPPGTLDETATAGVALKVLEKDPQEPALAPPAAEDVVVAPVVDITFQGGAPAFKQPAKLAFAIERPDRKPIDTRKTKLTAMYKHVETDPWTPIPDAKFNAATGVMTLSVDHLTIFTVLASPRVAQPDIGGSCPLKCSGHGSCVDQGQCACYANWEGAACERRKCPYSAAWGVQSDATAQPHAYAECSQRGVCNHETGQCECFDGYTGAACDRTTCPNACSGHGKCRTIRELQGGDVQGWGGDHIQACLCDGGFFGPDCSQRLCPMGDDPMTLCDPNAPTQQVQRVSFTFNKPPPSPSAVIHDEASLTWTDARGERWSSQRIQGIWASDAAGADSMRQALLNLPNHVLPSVTVQPVTPTASSSRSYSVTFSSAYTAGNQHLLACPDTMGCAHAGCAPIYTQPRHVEVTVTRCVGTGTCGTNDPLVTVSDDSVVRPPFAAMGEWDLEATMELYKSVSTGEYSYTVQFSSGGQPVVDPPMPAFRGFLPGSDDAEAGEPVHLGYGLVVTIDLAATSVPTDGTEYTVKVQYAAAHCSVTEETPANEKSEAKECGNRGLCNRVTGECACFRGFTGFACGTPTILDNNDDVGTPDFGRDSSSL